MKKSSRVHTKKITQQYSPSSLLINILARSHHRHYRQKRKPQLRSINGEKFREWDAERSVTSWKYNKRMKIFLFSHSRSASIFWCMMESSCLIYVESLLWLRNLRKTSKRDDRVMKMKLWKVVIYYVMEIWREKWWGVQEWFMEVLQSLTQKLCLQFWSVW